MRRHQWRRRWAAGTTGAVIACLLPTLAGCRQYERRPLDLPAHRAAVVERSLDAAPLEAFVARLDALGAAAPRGFSFDDGLSPAEGEVVALFYNAELRRARLAAGVALADYETAGLWEDPVFGFDGAEIWSPSAPFLFGLRLGFTIPISGRLEVERERAGAAYEAELRRIVDAEWRTRAEVRRAWGTWTAASERRRVLEDVIGQVERISAITDRLAAAGELSRAEARVFRVELAERRAEIGQVELEVLSARIELLGLMGLDAAAAIELEPALVAAVLPETDDALERLIAANTELAVHRARYRVAEETLRLEIRRQYPDVTIGAGYGSEDRDDRLLLGLAIPIPVLNANRAGIAEAGAERDVARAEAEIAYERLARALALAAATLETARARRLAYEAEIVPMLAEQSAELEAIARLGEVDTLLLLDTVTQQYAARSRLIDLRVAELDAGIEVERLLGPDDETAPAPVADVPRDDRSTNDEDAAARAAGGDA